MNIGRPFHLTRHRLAIAALIVFLVLLVSSAAFKNHIDQGAAWTILFAETHPLRGALLFVLFSALSAMMAFASSAVFVPPATLVWGELGAFLLLWGGWTLGAAAAYGIGRLATPLLIRLGYEKKLARYHEFVSREMGFWAVLLFCLAVPSEVPGYLFGSAHYRFFKFMAAMAIAEAAYAAGLVVAGEGLVSVRPANAILIIGFVIILALTATTLARKLKKKA